ncbi:MAG: DUF3138 family protein [Pseudomonadota bacterium]
MKQKKEGKLSSLPKLSVLAVALACGGVLPAHAEETPEQMRQRIEQLETQIKQLTALVEQAVAKVEAVQAAAADSEEQRAEFNRIRVKVESMEDQNEALGMKDLQISGMIDPTFIYNKARDSAGFNFLNNFDGRDGNEVYAYDNSYFGQALLQFDKELEGGTKLRLALAPHKSASSGFNLGSIVHEASMSMPITDSNTRFIAGQMPDWSGYEYYFGHQNKLITHNLLFDFTLPSFYTGAGVDVTRGKWWTRAMIGNMNKASHPDSETNPMLSYRVDYSKGEFQGFGFAGQHGELDDNRLDMFEFDAYFIRGDLSWMGQLSVGKWKNNAFDGGDATWKGFSTLLGYKLTPRFEAIGRLDYLNNSKHGGGTIGTAFNCIDSAAADPLAPAVCDDTVATQLAAGDYRNGFGPTAADAAAWTPGTSINGANRTTLSLGVNYALTTNVMLKAEYRIDHADIPVFYYVDDGSYKKNNHMFGVSTVLSF